MSADHAPLAPSASHIWMNCPGAPALIGSLEVSNDAGDDPDYIREGVQAHAFVAHCLWLCSTPSEIRRSYVKGDEREEWAGDFAAELDEYAENLEDYAQFAYSLTDRVVEKRVLLSPSVWGTMDLAGLTPVEDVPDTFDLHIADLKYGKGAYVDERENSQLRIYALGALNHYVAVRIRNVHLHIFQPRWPSTTTEPHRTEVLTLEELEAWRKSVYDPAVAEVLVKKDRAPLRPGVKQCNWCPARSSCSAFSKYSLERVMHLFPEVVPVKALSDMEPAELASLYGNLSLISKSVEDVKQVASERAHEGVLPGYKLIQGLKNREWKDPEAAEFMLEFTFGKKPEFYTTVQLKSPAQVEAQLPKAQKKIVNTLTIRPPGNVRVVADTHKSPAVIQDRSDEFDEVDDTASTVTESNESPQRN